MTEPNQKSVISNQKSPIIRISLLILIAIAVLATGHFALRWLGGPGRARTTVKVDLGKDAGRDAPDVPRPPRSELIGNISSEGGAPRSGPRYASQAAPDEIVQFYRAEMPRRGWTEETSLPGANAGDGGAELYYSNASGVWCIIRVSRMASGETFVTVVRTPLTGGANGEK